MTIEQLKKGCELAETLQHVQNYASAIRDAISDECVLFEAMFFVKERKDSHQPDRINISARYLPEINLADVLVKVEARIAEIQKELDEL